MLRSAYGKKWKNNLKTFIEHSHFKSKKIHCVWCFLTNGSLSKSILCNLPPPKKKKKSKWTLMSSCLIIYWLHTGFELVALWSEKVVESSMEMAELENCSPHEAQKWMLSPTMSSTLWVNTLDSCHSINFYQVKAIHGCLYHCDGCYWWFWMFTGSWFLFLSSTVYHNWYDKRIRF